MRNAVQKYNFSYCIGALAIFLIPFVSLPVLPSTYRPVSIYFFMILSLIFFMDKQSSFNKQDVGLLFFVAFVLCYGAVFYWVGPDFDLLLYFKEVISIVIGVCVFFGMRYFLMRHGFQAFIKICIYSYGFILFLGVVELLSIVGVIPVGIKEILNLILSGKHHERIQLATMEPSWAARTLVFLLIVYAFYGRAYNKHWKVYLFLGVIVFFTIFSLDSILLVVGSVFVCLIYYKKFILIFVLMIASVLMIVLLGEFSAELGGYYFSRISALYESDYYELTDMLYYDQSIFVRFSYPVNALMVYFENLFGVGLGQYSLYFSDSIIKNFGSHTLVFPEVASNVFNDSGDPRSMYAKIIVETSLLGFLGFIYWLFSCYSARGEVDMFRMVFFIFAMVSLLNFDSWAYLYLWISCALLVTPNTKESFFQRGERITE